MKRTVNRWKVMAMAAFTLLIVAVILFGLRTSELSDRLNRARLEKESLLSENIHLNKTVEALRREIEASK
jgi:hypothetical protein